MRSRGPGAPKIGTHKAFIGTYVVSKFQLSTFQWLLADKRISKIFDPKIPIFARFFCCLNSRSRDLGSLKIALLFITLLFILMLSPKIQRFRFKTFFFYYKQNQISFATHLSKYQNGRVNIKVLRARAKSIWTQFVSELP